METNAKQADSSRDSLFEFSLSSGCATATLSELIRHLGAEVEKLNGEPITTKSLRRTLDFLNRAIGISVTDKDQQLPLSLLRTVRLLFLADLNSSRNLFALLAPPESDAEATMEFNTVTTVTRDREGSAVIGSLIDSLSKEIAADRLRMFSTFVGVRQGHSVTELLILHAERTSDEIYQMLQETLSGEERALSDAYLGLATLLEGFGVARSDEHHAPANEELYVYLQALGFQHYALHYPLHMERTRVLGDVADIESEGEALCRLAADGQPHHGAASGRFSLNTFQSLVQAWPKEIAALVEKATGIATSVKQLKANQDRAKVLLTSYAYRSFDCTDADAPLLSVYDVVAALASFRYQQESGNDYQPYWHGQVDQGRSPQRHFDKGLNSRDPHQHQGVMHIYLNRFYEYQAALCGRSASHRAWMRYQTATLKAYHSILKLNDIMAVVVGLTSLNFLCVNYAKDYVIEHLRSTQ